MLTQPHEGIGHGPLLDALASSLKLEPAKFDIADPAHNIRRFWFESYTSEFASFAQVGLGIDYLEPVQVSDISIQKVFLGADTLISPVQIGLSEFKFKDQFDIQWRMRISVNSIPDMPLGKYKGDNTLKINLYNEDHPLFDGEYEQYKVTHYPLNRNVTYVHGDPVHAAHALGYAETLLAYAIDLVQQSYSQNAALAQAQ